MNPTPRSILAAVAAALLTAAAPAAPSFADTPGELPSADPATGGAMQIIAHEDDDLLFMNPDVDRAIAAGIPSVTVYLTAGEITGDGTTPAERARNRQRGAMAAYAHMAGMADGDHSSQREWSGDVWTVSGKQIERYRLRNRPSIQLLFLNLHDGNLRNIASGGQEDTVVPAGGLLSAPSHYARADVISVLTGVLETYRPTLLRTQDAAPDRHTDPSNIDHDDHVTGAVFANEASAAYTGQLYELSYRGYNTSSSPGNLGPDDLGRKDQILDEYGRFDQSFHQLSAGDPWLPRQYYRWSHGSTWSGLDANGRVHLFVVRSGQVQWYRQGTGLPNGWSAARQLAPAGGRLAPALAVGRDVDGRLVVVGHRLSDHHLVLLRQADQGDQFESTWRDLGSPNLGLGNEDQVGSPAVAAGEDGMLSVFVPNGGGGLSAISQSPTGSWASATWVELYGSDIQDGLSTVTTSKGLIEVYASTRGTVSRWAQASPGAVPQLDTAFRTGVPASPPKAMVDVSGRVQVVYLTADTGLLTATRQGEPGGKSWTTSQVSQDGTGDPREPAAALATSGLSGQLVLLARDRNSSVSLNVQRPNEQGFMGWSSVGGTGVDQATAIAEWGGQVVIAVVGPAGPAVARLTVRANSQVFAGWQRLRG